MFKLCILEGFFDSYTVLSIRNANEGSKPQKKRRNGDGKKLYYSFHPFKLNTQSVPLLFHCLVFTMFVSLLFNHHALRDITFVPLSSFVVVLGAASSRRRLLFKKLQSTRDIFINLSSTAESSIYFSPHTKIITEWETCTLPWRKKKHVLSEHSSLE